MACMSRLLKSRELGESSALSCRLIVRGDFITGHRAQITVGVCRCLQCKYTICNTVNLFHAVDVLLQCRSGAGVERTVMKQARRIRHRCLYVNHSARLMRTGSRAGCGLVLPLWSVGLLRHTCIPLSLCSCRSEQRCIVLPTYRCRLGHCLLFDRSECNKLIRQQAVTRNVYLFIDQNELDSS
jgi:hypothetical protein